jgi:putative endonuclease
MRDHTYFVYILASKSRVLYTGITNSVVRRTLEHRDSSAFGFTQRYRVWRLVYYELHQYVLNAIHREKQIKSWSRWRKIALIEENNPTWEDRSIQFGAKAELKTFAPASFGSTSGKQIATSGSSTPASQKRLAGDPGSRPPRNDNKKE